MPRLFGSSAMGHRQQAPPLGRTNLHRERRVNTVLIDTGAIAPGSDRYREAQNSVGSGGKSMLRAFCVADVEEPGIPALELHPEGLVEYPGSSLKHQVRSAF